MNANTTMTITVPIDLKARLTQLAIATRRSEAHLSADALAAFVDRELAVIAGIERGLADVAAGRTTPHREAMDRIDAIIDTHR